MRETSLPDLHMLRLDLVASREPVRSAPSSTELIDTVRNVS
jgi:hypothetical protein